MQVKQTTIQQVEKKITTGKPKALVGGQPGLKTRIKNLTRSPNLYQKPLDIK